MQTKTRRGRPLSSFLLLLFILSFALPSCGSVKTSDSSADSSESGATDPANENLSERVVVKAHNNDRTAIHIPVHFFGTDEHSIEESWIEGFVDGEYSGSVWAHMNYDGSLSYGLTEDKKYVEIFVTLTKIDGNLFDDSIPHKLTLMIHKFKGETQIFEGTFPKSVDGTAWPVSKMSIDKKQETLSINQWASYRFFGDETFNQIGEKIKSFGDLDQDGKKDFAVLGEFNHGQDGDSCQISIYLSKNLNENLVIDSDSLSYSILFSENSWCDAYNLEVSTAGDVDGDGLDDFAVTVSYQGVYVFLAKNLSVNQKYDVSKADYFLKEIEDQYPYSPSYGFTPLGDLDQDGLDDFAVTTGRDYRSYDEGKVFVFLSKNFNTATEYDLSTKAITLMAPPASGIFSEESFGLQVIGPGDLNGDKIPDLLVTSVKEEGADYIETIIIVPGDELLLKQDQFDMAAAAVIQNHESIDYYHNKQVHLNVVGDVDQDGRDDVMFSIRGAVYLFLAKDISLNSINYFRDASSVFYQEDSDDRFNVNLVFDVGDFDGDGYTDLLFGDESYGMRDDFFGDGRAYLLFGSPAGFASSLNLAQSSLQFKSDFGQSGHFAEQVTAIGDIDKDGLEDFMISDSRYNTLHEFAGGAIYFVLGRTIKKYK